MTLEQTILSVLGTSLPMKSRAIRAKTGGSPLAVSKALRNLLDSGLIEANCKWEYQPAKQTGTADPDFAVNAQVARSL